jgi:crossover junction endodeoxyribonuclease RusA
VTINLTLPYPPSANRLWRSSRGRVHKSTEYTNWLNHAGYVARAQRPGKICGPYRIWISAVAPDKRRRDLGNLEKPISDLLQSLGIIDDDSNARAINLQWVDAGEPITITVEAI